LIQISALAGLEPRTLAS